LQAEPCGSSRPGVVALGRTGPPFRGSRSQALLRVCAALMLLENEMAVRVAPPAPLTYTQLERLREKLDDRNRYELIAGDLEVSPSPGVAHQWVVGQLYRVLSAHVWTHGLGMVFVAPLDVILTDHDVVEPDMLYLTGEQVARSSTRAVEEPPTLVVEVLSPSTAERDRTLKRALYERQGVPHYWLADPLGQRLDAYELRDGRYHLAASLTGSVDFEPTLSPSLVIHLAEVWPPPLETPAALRRLGFLAGEIAVPNDVDRMGEAAIEAQFRNDA